MILKQFMPIFFIGLAFLALIILFFLVRFLNSNFILILIGLILFVPLGIGGFFVWKLYKKDDNSKKPLFSILALLFISFLFIPNFVDAAVIPINGSGEVTDEDLEQLRIGLNEKLSTIQTDITILKEQQNNVVQENEEENPDFLLIVFPIILIQLLTTAITIFYIRNR